MSNEENPGGQSGQPGPYGGWQPTPQGGEYDDGATAFVHIDPDELAGLGNGNDPLAAPGHGYVPPMILPLTPAAGLDPAVTGSWVVQTQSGRQDHREQAGGETPGAVHWPDPNQQAEYGQQPYQDAYRDPFADGYQDIGQDAPADTSGPYGRTSSTTARWDFDGAAPAPAAGHADPAHHTPGGEPDHLGYDHGGQDRTAHEGTSHEGAAYEGVAYEGAAYEDAVREDAERPGHTGHTGQWTIPVADGDLPEESGEFAASSVTSSWYASTPPATLPGGAPAPWAVPEPAQEGAPDATAPQDPSEAAAFPGPDGDTEEPPASDGPEAVRPEELPGPAGHFEPSVSPGPSEPSERYGEPEAPGTPGAPGTPEESGLPVAPAPGGEEPPATGPAPGPVPEPAREQTPDPDRTPDPVEAPGPVEAPDPVEAPSPVEDRSHPHAPAHPHAPEEPAGAGAPAPAPAPGPDELAGTGEEPGAVLTVPSEHPAASYVLRVNGVDRPVTDAWIGESLLYVLRERLGLAGAKDGCSQGECGACNVQVDGRLVASCLVPAATTAGSEVRTVEGLAQDGEPSDIQRALARCGAVQCGFCIPGMAMTVHDLLEGNHAPSELETRQALCGNLCRCSGYRGVLDAVREVVAGRETAAADEDGLRIPHQAPPGAGGVQAAEPHEGDAR
ncbi:(2Fe-2S)-binding protein [Streptomyces nitrosporeus]|uniref:(2Fe-2S)-binding protein n=1 Tax=Streptomyces nitrosporeus TaxID=28894 RepID=A0A5J6FEK6_9ACTN|nr:(2Fe-2S)-binding protein [Streptomyces nitrosporeus]QEU74237.1 (2Fe-2S)-binding protein [Streptomyces nitrosporeus]GGY97055.1 hypothetical protein GCM10010327_29720 [Streptomyces nitrosporeus]